MGTYGIMCDDEDEALKYLELLVRCGYTGFEMRVAPGTEWERFNAAAAKARITRQTYFDMIYPDDAAEEPSVPDGYTVRKLTADDMPAIEAFRDTGGCADVHVNAIRVAFDGKGNAGLSPFGMFKGRTLIALSMLTLDEVRDFRKYDIGALFALDNELTDELTEIMWRYAVCFSVRDNALFGSGCVEDDDSPEGVAMCERAGLVKSAEYRIYRK